MNNKNVADIVQNEGLDYAILHYMSSDKIDDPVLRELWTKAAVVLRQINNILGEYEEDFDLEEDT